MEPPSDKTKIQLEITNWPKSSQWPVILTIFVALLGYGVTWYIDRDAHLAQIRDEKIRFEREQLQGSINRKMDAYEKVEKAIGNIRRIWYIARAKCAFDKSYATDPKKIEAVNLERWNARIDLMQQSYNLSLNLGTDIIDKAIFSFNEWERKVTNVCLNKSPSEEEYREKQSEITKLFTKELETDQSRLQRNQL